MTLRMIRTSDVKRLIVGIPFNHRHLRVLMELINGEVIIMQEATVAAIVRGYIGIKTHPKREGIEFHGEVIVDKERKEGFASWQLIEVESEDEDDLREELRKLIDKY